MGRWKKKDQERRPSRFGRVGSSVMGNSPSGSVKNHIQNAQKTGVCQLSGFDLKEFPSGLSALTKNLRSLDLSKNKIEFLPDSIGEFILLRNLNLDRNMLSSLPESLGKLKKLETLSVCDNRLSGLPQSLGSCVALQTLRAATNKLKTFPDAITGLRKLDAVDLHSNHIASPLPSRIGELNAVEINLNANRLSVIPAALAECPRLKVLRFEENNVELKNFATCILADSNVSLIVHAGNLFTEKSFQNLDGYDKYEQRYTATKKKFD